MILLLLRTTYLKPYFFEPFMQNSKPISTPLFTLFRIKSRKPICGWLASFPRLTDCLPGIADRFPAVGANNALQLSMLSLLDASQDIEGPECLVAAEKAGQLCARRGWDKRPTWISLMAGERPPNPPDNYEILGEWKHGWQFLASEVAEDLELSSLLRALAWPSTRVNAAAVGKSRMHSCMGPFAGSWLVA